MPLWGSIDQANNAPKYAINSTSPNTGIQLYGTQVVGLDDGEVAASSRANHTGWNRVQYGTGPVTAITITAGGTGYTNGEVVRIVGGTANAVASITTNGSGAITNTSITSSGAGFSNTSSLTVTVRATENGAASAGSGATFTITLGGRSGRVQTETLVALSAMTANGSTLAG